MIEKLWSIYLHGMDEYWSAPSYEMAVHMAKAHNDAMDAYYAKNPDKSGYRPTREEVRAEVTEWPFEADDHAEDIKHFDPKEWGIEGGAQ